MFWEELLQTERPEGQLYWPTADAEGRYVGMAPLHGEPVEQRACSTQQHAVEALSLFAAPGQQRMAPGDPNLGRKLDPSP
jgi:hypothetical protein